MAKRKARLPDRIMSDVLWAFSKTSYSSRADFEAAVRKYHFRIRQEDTWQADEVVLPCPRVRITSWYFDKRVLELTSDNGASFTALELLFKVHHALLEPHRVGNAVVQTELGDHRFFEGFGLDRHAAGETPTYHISLGS
jgi:hypothetical protein